MNIRKPLKNLFVFFIFLSVVALAGLSIYQHRQIQKIVQKDSAVSVDDAQTTTTSNQAGLPASLQKETHDQNVSSDHFQSGENTVDELQYQISAAQEELSMVQEQMAAEDAKKAKRKEIEMELHQKTLQDPSFKSNMKKSFDQEYADLFDKLNLSSEEREQFKDILFEEIISQQELFIAQGDLEDLSQEQRDEFHNSLMAINDEINLKKEAFLGEGNYETYQSYTETEFERHQVNSFNELLNSDDALTDAQKETLIEAMHNELQNVVHERLETEGETVADMNNEDNMSVILSNQEKEYDAYLKAATEILSASQLETLEEYIEGEREQFIIMMEMSALQQKDD